MRSAVLVSSLIFLVTSSAMAAETLSPEAAQCLRLAGIDISSIHSEASVQANGPKGKTASVKLTTGDKRGVTMVTPMGGFEFSLGDSWDPADAQIGRVPCQAKKYLLSLPRGWAGSSRKIDSVHSDDALSKGIIRLNPSFAVCVAQFVKIYKEKYGANEPVTITSAYRSPCDEISVCEGETGACAVNAKNRSQWDRACSAYKAGSYTASTGRPSHGNGTAVDIWPLTLDDVQRYSNDKQTQWVQEKIQRFHTFAVQSGSGLHFRLGMNDRPHLEPIQGKCGYGEPAFIPGHSRTGAREPASAGPLAPPFSTQPENTRTPAAFSPSGVRPGGVFNTDQLFKQIGTFPQNLSKMNGGSSSGGGTTSGAQSSSASNPNTQKNQANPIQQQQPVIPRSLYQALFGTQTPSQSALDQAIEKVKKRRDAIKKCAALKNATAKKDCFIETLK